MMTLIVETYFMYKPPIINIMNLNVYIVTEKIPYEKNNIWLVAATNKEEVKELIDESNNPSWWQTSIDFICKSEDFETPTIIYN